MLKHTLIGPLLLVAMASMASAADLVVITHPAAGPLTKEEISDIFLGRNATLVPVDQSESSPLYAEFYRKATGRDVAQVKSAWSKLVFAGKAQAPKQFADSQAVRKAVAADPKAIGYIEKSAVDASVKAALSLD